jgi:hypothetical protein
MTDEGYQQATKLIDRSINIARSMREQHTARFAVLAEHGLATLSWVACEVLGLSDDLDKFQQALSAAVDANPIELGAEDRTKTVHEVMRFLGVSFG